MMNNRIEETQDNLIVPGLFTENDNLLETINLEENSTNFNYFDQIIEEEDSKLYIDYGERQSAIRVDYDLSNNIVINLDSGESRLYENIEGSEISGGNGNDYIDVTPITGEIFSLIFTNSSIDTQTNHTYPYLNHPGLISNYIKTGEGDDIVIGGEGNDIIISGSGKNIIDGGGGHDQLEIDNSNYQENITIRYRDASTGYIINGPNNQTEFKNIEKVYILTGRGNDILNLRNAKTEAYLFSNFVDTNEGDDIVRGSNSADEIRTGSGDDTIIGREGNDNIHPGSGANVIRGGEGVDSLSIESEEDTENIIINYQKRRRIGTIQGGSQNKTEWREIEIIQGSTGSGDDIVDLSATEPQLLLPGEVPTFSTGKGNDLISGGRSDDIFSGEEGNDTLIGGGGSDILYGDEGSDRLIGVDPKSNLAGALEKDYLLGGRGKDEFILGDESQTYYTGYEDYDYVMIGDFNLSEDIIQLKGSHDEYKLENMGRDAHLYSISSEESRPDLIAEITGVSGLSLEESYFHYVS